MALESNIALEAERDHELMANWVLKRIDAEKTFHAVVADPSLPITMFENLNQEITTLTRFLSLGINRARMWGTEEEARGSTRILTQVLADIREDGTKS